MGSPYRSGRSSDWLKFKNPNAPAVKREAEEDWGTSKWTKKPRRREAGGAQSGLSAEVKRRAERSNDQIEIARDERVHNNHTEAARRTSAGVFAVGVYAVVVRGPSQLITRSLMRGRRSAAASRVKDEASGAGHTLLPPARDRSVTETRRRADRGRTQRPGGGDG